MYESYFGLHEKPFSLLPDPAFLFLSRKHGQALSLLEYGLLNQAGISVLTGDVGVGKTTLMRHLINRLGEDVTVGVISHTHRSIGTLLEWVCSAFDLRSDDKESSARYQRFVDFVIEQYANGRRTLLVVDEAQNLDLDQLEELRLLSNVNSGKDLILQTILLGQQQLRERLQLPELQQFVQRVGAAYHLPCLGADDTEQYIRHRLAVAGARRDLFTAHACEAVFEYSKGVPRLINLICDTALVYAYAAGDKLVTSKLVDEFAATQGEHLLIPFHERRKVRDPVPDEIHPETREEGRAVIDEDGAKRTVDPVRAGEGESGETSAAAGEEALDESRGGSAARRSPGGYGATGNSDTEERAESQALMGTEGLAGSRGDGGPSPRTVGAPGPSEASAERIRGRQGVPLTDVGDAIRSIQEEDAVSGVVDEGRGGDGVSRFGFAVRSLIVLTGLIGLLGGLVWLGVVGRDHTTVGLDDGKTLESFGRTTEELAGLADAPVDLVVREDAGLTVGGRELELGEGSVVLGPTATDGMADGSMTSVALGDHDMGGQRELRGDEGVASDGLNREVEAAASTVLEPEKSTSAPASAVAEARDPQIDAESVDDLLASTLLPRGSVQSGPAAVERGNGLGAQVEVAGSSDVADGPTKPPLSRDVTPESKAAARVSPSLSELATALDLVGIPVERAEGGRVSIDLGERVQFGSGSTTLSTDAKEFLEELAVILMQSAPLSVQVIGHTDRQGGREVNLMLSERRAEAVMMFLIDQGLSASHLKAEGRGESEPKVGLARERVLGPTVNRRIEIEVAPLADGEPDAS